MAQPPPAPERRGSALGLSWLAWHLPVNQDRVFHKLRQPVGFKEQGDVEDHVAVACRNDSPRQKEQSRSHSPTPRSARAAQPQLLELYSCSGGKSRARLPSSLLPLGGRKRFNSKLPQEKKKKDKKKQKNKKTTTLWPLSGHFFQRSPVKTLVLHLIHPSFLSPVRKCIPVYNWELWCPDTLSLLLRLV